MKPRMAKIKMTCFTEPPLKIGEEVRILNRCKRDMVEIIGPMNQRLIVPAECVDRRKGNK